MVFELVCSIIAMLDVWETFIPCFVILLIVHVEKLYNHAIHNLHVPIDLRMECEQHRYSCVELLPECFPKSVDKYGISIGYYCSW